MNVLGLVPFCDVVGYVGPAGLGALGMLVVVVAVLLIGAIGLILHPVRLILKHRKRAREEQPVDESTDGQDSSHAVEESN